jgi:hypothetical protein
MEKQNPQSDLYPELRSSTLQTRSETEQISTDLLIGEMTLYLLPRIETLLTATCSHGSTDEKVLQRIVAYITSAMPQLVSQSFSTPKQQELLSTIVRRLAQFPPSLNN